MKNYKITSLFFCLMLFFCECAMADASSGQCKVYGSGTVVATWLHSDSDGNITVQGAIGSINTSPTSWAVTTLSTGMSIASNSSPLIFSNANGDVVVLWQYPDSNGNFFVAAAMLPVGTTTWNTATISSSGESAGFNDQMASIDENGNILATWSVYDVNTNMFSLRCATAVMGTNTSWNSPLTIDQ